MITSKLADQPLVTEINPVAKNSTAPPQAVAVQKKADDAKKGPAESVRINKQHFELFNSQPAYSKFNLVAATVRGADEAMHKIETRLDEMKDRLLEHVKHYPPFGKGSQERVKLMKLFSAFRKEIDQLTIPPDNYGAMKILADPSATSDAGNWDIDLDTQGDHLTLHGQQVHTGPAGLDIPEIAGEATDDDITAAIKNLESAHATLGQRRSELAADFEHILNQTHLWE